MTVSLVTEIKFWMLPKLFGGYTRYQNAADSWNRVNKVPAAVRSLAS
jgi:hypothetical protein